MVAPPKEKLASNLQYFEVSFDHVKYNPSIENCLIVS